MNRAATAARILGMATPTLAPTTYYAPRPARASDAAFAARLAAGVVLVVVTLGGAPLVWLVSILAVASCTTDGSLAGNWHCSEAGQAVTLLALPVGGLLALVLAAAGLALSRRPTPAPTTLLAAAYVLVVTATLLSLPL